MRSPRSVEALGRVDVVCFDKTGTLSENRLRVARIEAAAGSGDDDVLTHAARATPPANGDGHGHATDAAVAGAAHEVAGQLEPPEVHLPFRSGRPFSASIYGRDLSIKGAPEVVLAPVLEFEPKFRPAWSAPKATVRTSSPSLKPTSAIEIVGPCRLTGPSESVRELVPPPGAESDSVKLWVWPGALSG